MGLLQSMKNFFVGEDEIELDEEFQPDYESGKDDYIKSETISQNITNQGGGRQVKMQQTQTLQLVLARPKDFSEVKSIGDDLKAQKTVILNLELVKSEDAKRILDFLSGVAYAMNAVIKMMATKTFAIMPEGVDYQGIDLMVELENNGYNF